MQNKEIFIAYVHSNSEWWSWVYSYGEIVKKLGEFASKQEAVTAVDLWKKEKGVDNGSP